jgi:hypothetical protein
MHKIHQQLDAFNARATALNERMRATTNDATEEIVAIGKARGQLYTEAHAAGFVRLFDGRYRLSGKQVLQVERGS